MPEPKDIQQITFHYDAPPMAFGPEDDYRGYLEVDIGDKGTFLLVPAKLAYLHYIIHITEDWKVHNHTYHQNDKLLKRVLPDWNHDIPTKDGVRTTTGSFHSMWVQTICNSKHQQADATIVLKKPRGENLTSKVSDNKWAQRLCQSVFRCKGAYFLGHTECAIHLGDIPWGYLKEKKRRKPGTDDDASKGITISSVAIIIPRSRPLTDDDCGYVRVTTTDNQEFRLVPATRSDMHRIVTLATDQIAGAMRPEYLADDFRALWVTGPATATGGRMVVLKLDSAGQPDDITGSPLAAELFNLVFRDEPGFGAVLVSHLTMLDVPNSIPWGEFGEDLPPPEETPTEQLPSITGEREELYNLIKGLKAGEGIAFVLSSTPLERDDDKLMELLKERLRAGVAITYFYAPEEPTEVQSTDSGDSLLQAMKWVRDAYRAEPGQDRLRGYYFDNRQVPAIVQPHEVLVLTTKNARMNHADWASVWLRSDSSIEQHIRPSDRQLDAFELSAKLRTVFVPVPWLGVPSPKKTRTIASYNWLREHVLYSHTANDTLSNSLASFLRSVEPLWGDGRREQVDVLEVASAFSYTYPFADALVKSQYASHRPELDWMRYRADDYGRTIGLSDADKDRRRRDDMWARHYIRHGRFIRISSILKLSESQYDCAVSGLGAARLSAANVGQILHSLKLTGVCLMLVPTTESVVSRCALSAVKYFLQSYPENKPEWWQVSGDPGGCFFEDLMALLTHEYDTSIEVGTHRYCLRLDKRDEIINDIDTSARKLYRLGETAMRGLMDEINEELPAVPTIECQEKIVLIRKNVLRNTMMTWKLGSPVGTWQEVDVVGER